MLVVCGRCDTEYEFDDALLSERGTTVKCTNCGYQFRVRPPRGLRPTSERWVVRSSGGPERVFGSLRDLRKAIDERTVSIDDELSRDGGPFRVMRSVAELAALFRRVLPAGPAAPYGQTLMGVGGLKADAEISDSAPPPPPAAGLNSPLPTRPSVRPGVSPPVVGPPVVGPPMAGTAPRQAAIPVGAGPSARPAGPPGQPPRVSSVPAVAPPPRINPPMASPPPMPPRTSPLPPARVSNPGFTATRTSASAIPSPDAITARPPPGALASTPQVPQAPGVPRVSIPLPAGAGPSVRPTPLRPAGLGGPTPGASLGPVPTQPSQGAFGQVGAGALGESVAPGTMPAGGGRTPLPAKGPSFPPTRRSEPAERPTPLISESTHLAYLSQLAQQRPAGAPIPQELGADTQHQSEPAPTTPKVRPEGSPIVAGTWGSSGASGSSGFSPGNGAVAGSGGALAAPVAVAGPLAFAAEASSDSSSQLKAVASSELAAAASALSGGASSAGVQFASVPPSTLESWPSTGVQPAVLPTPAIAVAAPGATAVNAPFEFSPPRRKAGGMRWVIALVFVGGLAVLAGTAGKDYLLQFARPKPVAISAPVSEAVGTAQAAFQKGQVEQARTALQQLAAANAGEPAARSALAELALADADFEWLRVRLWATDVDRKAAAEQALAVKVRTLQAALGALAEGDVARRRVEVETLRLQGRVPAAREQVQRLTIDPNDADASYALGMLDLAESEPPWTRIVSRFAQLIGHEGPWGRARPALIYALLRSGDAARAKSELEQWAAASPAHPLLADFQAAIGAAPAAVSAASASALPTDAAGSVAIAAGEAPLVDLPAVSGKGDVSLSYTARQLLEGAAAARASGDLAGAKNKYQQALTASPGNLAALSGLGGVARLEGKYQEAKGYYDQVLDRNPDYSSAVVGGADVRWLMGNREGALVLYRKVQAGNPFYSHAQHRIEEVQGKAGTEPGAAPPGPAPTVEAAPKPEVPKAETPKVETPPEAPKAEAPKPEPPKAEPPASPKE